MLCKICTSDSVSNIYTGEIRLGMKIGYSQNIVQVYQCNDCGLIWHNYHDFDSAHYESDEYRIQVEGTSDIDDYYKLHDKDVIKQLSYTGTEIFRNKIVADIGCAGGSFIDFIHSVAAETIAIEPSETYRSNLVKKGHKIFKYADEVPSTYLGKIDVVTSFDVIEHVNEPATFVKDIFQLLKPGGIVVVGTPTDYPILRELLGKSFDRFIFQANHPWVFSENSLKRLFQNGFNDIRIQQKFNYGLGNCLSWLKTGKPLGDIKYDFISETLNKTWQNELIRNGKGEYLVLNARKN